MHRTQEPQKPRELLFVFHHAGGSHLAYRHWQPSFPTGRQAHHPDAPGRGPRDKRRALHDATALVDHYLHTHHDTMNGRFAFLGHSLDATVAYEPTRRLIDDDRTPPPWHGIPARNPIPAIPHPHGSADAPNATRTTSTTGTKGGMGTAGTTGTTPTTHAPVAADAADTTAASGTAYTTGTASMAGTAVTRLTRGADGTGVAGSTHGAGSTQDAKRAKARRDNGNAAKGRPGGSGERERPGGSGEAGRVGGGMQSGEGVPDTVSPVGGGGRHLLSDAELRCQLAAMDGTPPQVLARPQLWELFAPVIRADLRINETWRPGPAGAPLPVQLSVFGGRREQVAPPHLLGGWARTCEPFLGIRLFDGGHFSFQDRLPDVA
ncbi:thioesterase domain-containing protein, partial [Streptomyces sp. NPDC005534]